MHWRLCALHVAGASVLCSVKVAYVLMVTFVLCRAPPLAWQNPNCGHVCKVVLQAGSGLCIIVRKNDLILNPYPRVGNWTIIAYGVIIGDVR